MSNHCLHCQQRCRRSAWRNYLRPELAICILTLGLGVLSLMQSKGSDSQEMVSGAGKTEVAIDNFSFLPKEITVAAGTTVVWTNHDDVPHTVASADDQFKKSAALDTDETFSHTFTTAGTFTYFCSIHPHMTGKVIVK
jgi:plastocyanin